MNVDKAQELTVKMLAERDEIILVTDHNTYHFVVEVPGEGRGVLQGGDMAAGRTAYFCGVVDGHISFRPSAIRSGGRALFLVEEIGDCASCRRVVTSKVVEVRVIKNGTP